MPSVNDVLLHIDNRYPFCTQMDFDNAGFLIGRSDSPVTKVLLSLDITPGVALEASNVGAQLIVSHHPVIFNPIKSVTDQDPVGQTLLILAENRIAAICVHTNLDKAPGGVNDVLARTLGLDDIGYLETVESLPSGDYGIGRFGTLAEEMPLAQFCKSVKQRLSSNGIRYASCGKPVKKVAVGGGACHDYIKNALLCGCDTFVTSDLKYNDFLDACDIGINLVDAGHFPTENVIMPILGATLQLAFPDVTVIFSTHSEAIKYI